MNSFLPRFFGIHTSDASRVVEWQLVSHASGNAAWIVLLGIVLGGISWFLYFREETVSLPRKIFLATLRTLFLVGLLALLLKPTLRFTLEGSVRRAIIVLIDGTASMKIEDPRTDDTDLKRAAIAMAYIKSDGGLSSPLPAGHSEELSHPPRMSLLKSALKNPQLDLLNRLGKEYDLRPYVFTNSLADIATAGGSTWVESITSDGTSTALGDAVRDVLSRTRGQPLAGVFITTDGANNAGSAPDSAAESAGQAGVPLYIWGVGLPSPRDIIVASVYAQEIAFIDDQVGVTVRVRSVGLDGQTAKIVLKQGDDQVGEQEVKFGPDGEQVVQMNYTPGKAGSFKLTASIAPRADEVVKDNNSQSTDIRIIDGKIKVLLVEQSPRWEFKYLQAMLLRDRRVDLKCVLQEIDPGMLSIPGSPYLPHLPPEKKDLYNYDLVIFGDVDPRNFASGELATINEYVSKFGGGMLFIAGRLHNPGDYRGTPLEKMLPVETEDSTGRGSETGGDRPINLELTAAGRSARMLRLADTDQASTDVWSKLPPIYWDARVARAKPAAEVLLVDADPAKSSRFGKMPVMAIQQYGLGQVMYVGTDNVWRWRRNAGDKYYSMLWGQILQRLALPHLLGESKRTQLTLDKKAYSTGERVTVYARLYNDGYDPVIEPAVRGYYEQVTAGGVPGTRPAVVLRPLPEQPGMYRGEFTAPSAGGYQFSVERDEKTRLAFAVTEPMLELGDTAMNLAGLQSMAKSSGGAFFREEDLYKLPDSVTKKAEKVQSSVDVDLWASPLYFGLLIAIVTAEWILRKMSRLK